MVINRIIIRAIKENRNISKRIFENPNRNAESVSDGRLMMLNKVKIPKRVRKIHTKLLNLLLFRNFIFLFT